MAIQDAAPAVDADAFGRLFDDWLDPIYGFVARRVADREAVEEVTARTFERALDVLLQGRGPPREIGGFLLRVASSAVVDHARRLRREIPAGVRASDLDEDGDAEAALWLADAVAARMFAAAVDGIALRRATLTGSVTRISGRCSWATSTAWTGTGSPRSWVAQRGRHRPAFTEPSNALTAELSRSEPDVA